MKVALVIERMDPTRGGRERSVAELALLLSRAGCQVTMLCSQAHWPDAPVAVEVLPATGGSRAGRLRAFAGAVEAHAAGAGYDVVHSTLPLGRCDVYQPRGGTVPGQKRASLRRRGPLGGALAAVGWMCNPLRRLQGRYERRLVARGDVRCLAVSEMVAQEFQTHYGRRENVHVVYNGVDAPRLSREARVSERQGKRKILGLGPEDPLFVSAATNFPLKGVGELLRAFAVYLEARKQHTDRPARLVVLGRDQPIAYAREADRLGIGLDVEFPGLVDDVEPWLAAATATVLLSWYDPCSRVVLESVACGVPAITTAWNGAAEVLEDGAGLVVESPRAGDEVASAMARMSRPEEHVKFTAACEAASRRVSMERHVEQLLDIYREIAEDR